MKCRKRLQVAILFLTTGLVFQILPRVIEGFGQWYSTNVYPFFVLVIGQGMGVFPFSVAEIGVYLLIICLIYMIAKAVVKKQISEFVINIFLISTILFFLYCVNCGVNYYRTSFAEMNALDVQEYTVYELKNTCIWLTENVNKLAEQVERDENGVMLLSVDEQEMAIVAMNHLGNRYPELKGCYPQPKRLLNHWILSVQQLSGVYSPFTIEANYNSGMTDYNKPFTACHELSHLRGFMQEEEANFIAFLACTKSDIVDFQYSGHLLGWINSMNLLYRIDYEAWEEIRILLSENVEADLKANSRFWSQYDGTVAEVADKINDTYLKANGQDDGVFSYGRMADLIVIYYREEVE